MALGLKVLILAFAVQRTEIEYGALKKRLEELEKELSPNGK